MDWVITDPSDTIVLEGERDRQGDYIFTGNAVGEYSFCFRYARNAKHQNLLSRACLTNAYLVRLFSNDMSSFSEKLVDFDIMVESEPRNIAPAKPTSMTEQSSSLEESIYKLSGSLSSIQRTQKCKPSPHP